MYGENSQRRIAGGVGERDPFRGCLNGGALPAGRCEIIAADGSTARIVVGGSYDPAPAPTLTTVLASPSAAQIAAWIRGSERRVAT
jgi:hypothetical protein